MPPNAKLVGLLVGLSVVAGVALGVAVLALLSPGAGRAPELPVTAVDEVPLSGESRAAQGPLEMAERSAESDDRMTPIAPPGERSARTAEGAPVGPTVASDGRIRAIVLVEPNFRGKHPDWRALVTARSAEASQLLHGAAGIDLELVAAPFEWTPSRRWTGLDDLLPAIELDAAPYLRDTGATLAIGIAAQVGALTSGRMCGLARDLRNSCVVLDLQEVNDAEGLSRITLAHEVGHCFGCFHVADASSIMTPSMPGASMPDHFDLANQEVLQLTRGCDLSLGEKGLPESVLRRIAELARDHGVPGEHNPGAGAFEQRAYRALAEEDDPAECARLSRIAIRFEPDRAYAHYNLAVALGQLNRRDEASRELDEATRVDPGFAAKPQARRLREALTEGERRTNRGPVQGDPQG